MRSAAGVRARLKITVRKLSGWLRMLTGCFQIKTYAIAYRVRIGSSSTGAQLRRLGGEGEG